MKVYLRLQALALLFAAWLVPAYAASFAAGSFAGADASIQINACIAAVISAGGGVCDASALTGTQPMSQQINLGSPASVQDRIGITLLLPNSAVWIWKITDGSSCGLYQYSSTSIIGQQPGGGGNRMVLEAKSGSDMDSIYCTDDAVDGVYVRAEGFSVWNNQPGSTFANGVVHIRQAVDQSSFTRIFAENYYGDVWHIESACCGSRFEMIQGTSNGTPGLNNGSSGGVPLTVGPGKVTAISIHDASFNTPGTGHPDIDIEGPHVILGVDFFNIYMEGNGLLDATTPMVYIGTYAGPVHFFGGVANTKQSALSSTKPVFENHGWLLDIPEFETVNTTYGINDVTAKSRTNVVSYDLYTDIFGSITSYITPSAASTTSVQSQR